MTDSAAVAPTEVPDELRWLRAARAAAFCSLSLFLIAVMVTAFLEARENGAKNLVFALFTSSFWLPYLWMLWQMKARSGKRRKKGLALAIAYGAWALMIAAPSALASSGLALQGSLAIFALLQLSLILSGMKTYHAMEKEPGDTRILVNRILGVSTCLGILCLAAIHIPCMVRSGVAADEASSVNGIRTICTAQTSYAKKNPRKGFASALSELGPPPGADLIDQQLASGTRSGYSFHMIAARPDASGRIAQYAVVARPLSFGQTGRRSFFADASGVIRSTAEDRAPTAQDPPLD
jgi:hypothetical protein